MSSTGEPFGLFWNSENRDRTYDANSFEYWLKKFFTSGVFEGELQVLATSGMTVKVGAGYANVDGKVKFWNAEFNLTLSPANSTYPRIDTIVITRDNVNRNITCEVVTGGYSGDEPIPTSPVRTSEIYQLVIAQIYVDAGATEVTQSVITDTRPDLDLCGYITGTVQNLDFSQLMAQFETYFEEYKASFEQTMSNWESAQEADYATWFNSIVNQYISDKSDWDSWYADLRESLHMLPQDSAEYLQIEINELQETASGSIFNVDTIQSSLIGQSVSITSEDGAEVKTATFEAYRNKLENTGTSQTINGITYTVMADGTVVANGTASAESRFYINEDFTATAGQKLSGCPADGSAVTYQLRVGDVSDDSGVGIDVGSGYTFSAGTYKISINIASGRTVSNLVFEPMVREAADTNTEYEQYSDYVAHAKIVGVTYVGDLTVQSTDSLQTATLVADVPYFARYHVVLAFWQATINLQGDTNLYGATVTVKNSSDVTVGTVTLSAQDGTGTWYAEGPDTYTFNYTFSGTDYSEELVVDEETTYNLELTAGFSWTTWVDTASELDSSDYASLSEVLADEKALRELFLEHACVDYMAELTSSNEDLETVINNDYCAKWINNSDYALDYLHANEVIADLMDEADKYGYGEWVITDDTTTPPTWGPKGNVPVMTSDTAPYGVASGLTWVETGREAYKAFNGEGDASSWGPKPDATNVYLQYKSTTPICVKKALYRTKSASTAPSKTLQLQASNDGSSWVDLGSVTITNNNNVWTNFYIDCPNNNTHYLYHRFFSTEKLHVSNSYSYACSKAQFYGRELKVSVPTMTSNTAPYGEAFGSNTASGYQPYYAFIGSDTVPTVSTTTTNRWTSNSSTAPQSMGYKFNNQIVVKMVKYAFGINNSSNPNVSTTFKVQGSNDNVTWYDLSEEITETGRFTTPRSCAILNNALYKYHRFTITAQSITGVTNIGQVSCCNFYGLDYSEKEFEVGTTKKWLYDHGVELEEITLQNSNANAKGEKRSASIYLYKTGASNSSQINTPKIDLTPYSLIRVKVGDDIYSADGNVGYVIASSVENFDYDTATGRVASYNMKTSSAGVVYLPNNVSCNISNVNQTLWCQIAVGSTSSATIKNEIVEWWLE